MRGLGFQKESPIMLHCPVVPWMVFLGPCLEELFLLGFGLRHHLSLLNALAGVAQAVANQKRSGDPNPSLFQTPSNQDWKN